MLVQAIGRRVARAGRASDRMGQDQRVPAMRYVWRRLLYAIRGDWLGNGWKVYPMYDWRGLSGEWAAIGPMSRFCRDLSFEIKNFDTRRSAVAFAQSEEAGEYFQRVYPDELGNN